MKNFLLFGILLVLCVGFVSAVPSVSFDQTDLLMDFLSLGQGVDFYVTIFNTGDESLVWNVSSFDSDIYFDESYGVAGEIASGDFTTIRIFATMNSCGGLSSGFHVFSNDPVNPDQVINVVLTPILDPLLGVSSASFSFTNTFVGYTGSQQLNISNSGCGDLELTGYIFDNNVAFTSDCPLDTFVLAFNESFSCNIFFSPVEEIFYEDNLHMYSNDPASGGDYAVFVSGTPCTPNWECSSFNDCTVNNVSECVGVTDLNSCGVAFSGSLSDYDSSCNYNNFCGVWTPLTSEGISNWADITSSDDGSKLVAVPLSPIGHYSGVASSSSGKYVVRNFYPSFISTSDNFGVDWTSHFPAGQYYWFGVASSGDGSHIVGVTRGGGGGIPDGSIWTSDNFGVDWTSHFPAGVTQWKAVASNSDGSRIIAVDAYGLSWTSDDFGVSWTEQLGSYSFGSVASSDSGQYIVGTYDYIYTSDDFGVSWTAQTNSGVKSWRDVACDSDCSHIVASEVSGNLYSSNDSGVSWNVESSAGVRNWWGVAISSQGSIMYATDNGGYLWAFSPWIAGCPDIPVCSPNWSCSSFGLCVGGVSSCLNVVDNNSCDALFSGDLNDYSVSCVPSCVESWLPSYTPAVCSEGVTERLLTYADNNSCNTTVDLPLDNGTSVPCECVESWSEHYTICTGSHTLYYVDNHACGSVLDLPVDNGSVSSCGGSGGSIYIPPLPDLGVDAVALSGETATGLSNTGGQSVIVAVGRFFDGIITWFQEFFNFLRR